jgi:hypothetical protein
MVDGAGASAGASLFREIDEAFDDEADQPPPETEAQKRARVAREKKEAEAAAREAAKREKRVSEEIDAELRALKKKLAQKKV